MQIEALKRKCCGTVYGISTIDHAATDRQYARDRAKTLKAGDTCHIIEMPEDKSSFEPCKCKKP